MTIKSPFVIAAIAAVFPAALVAQDISGAATFGYGLSSASDGFPDTSVRALDGKIGLTYANGLRLGASATSGRADVDGIAEDVSVNVFGFTGGAAFADFWNAGAYYEYASLGVDGFGDTGIDSYGVFVGYDSDLMALEAFLGETDGDALNGTGVDWKDLGARGSFNIGMDAAVGGHVMRSRLSGGGAKIDLTSVGLGGHYAFGNGLTGYAGITRGEVDDLDGTLTTFGAGVGYDLSMTAGFPATVSVELARSQIDDGVDKYNENTLRFGVTVPFGGGKGVPMNSVASGAMNPNRTALTTAIVGSF